MHPVFPVRACGNRRSGNQADGVPLNDGSDVPQLLARRR